MKYKDLYSRSKLRLYYTKDGAQVRAIRYDVPRRWESIKQIMNTFSLDLQTAPVLGEWLIFDPSGFVGVLDDNTFRKRYSLNCVIKML